MTRISIKGQQVTKYYQKGKYMTEREVNSIYYINFEIEQIKKSIREIDEKLRELSAASPLSAVTYSGMPHGSTPGKPTEEKAVKYISLEAELKEQLQKNKALLCQKQIQLEIQKAVVEQFINTIDDYELKMIVKLRCIELDSWEEIGQKLSIDRRTASRKFKKIFEN